MTPQTLNMIALVFYTASLLCLIVGIYFFFSLHIVEVFNDLTGRTVKKQLQRIQTQPQPQSQAGKPSLPSNASQTSKKNAKKSDVIQTGDREIQLDAGVHQDSGSEPTDVLFSDSEPTTLLEKEEAMTGLDSKATTVLSSSSSTSNTSESMIHVLKREVVIHAEIDQELKKIETDS